jgi:hypothetical protein
MRFKKFLQNEDGQGNNDVLFGAPEEQPPRKTTDGQPFKFLNNFHGAYTQGGGDMGMMGGATTGNSGLSMMKKMMKKMMLKKMKKS